MVSQNITMHLLSTHNSIKQGLAFDDLALIWWVVVEAGRSLRGSPNEDLHSWPPISLERMPEIDGAATASSTEVCIPCWMWFHIPWWYRKWWCYEVSHITTIERVKAFHLRLHIRHEIAIAAVDGHTRHPQLPTQFSLLSALLALIIALDPLAHLANLQVLSFQLEFRVLADDLRNRLLFGGFALLVFALFSRLKMLAPAIPMSRRDMLRPARVARHVPAHATHLIAALCLDKRCITVAATADERFADLVLDSAAELVEFLGWICLCRSILPAFACLSAAHTGVRIAVALEAEALPATRVLAFKHLDALIYERSKVARRTWCQPLNVLERHSRLETIPHGERFSFKDAFIVHALVGRHAPGSQTA
jgi:hypothetical protein